jgi:hypothetical protein
MFNHELQVKAKLWHSSRVDGFIFSPSNESVVFCDDEGHIGVWRLLPERWSPSS